MLFNLSGNTISLKSINLEFLNYAESDVVSFLVTYDQLVLKITSSTCETSEPCYKYFSAFEHGKPSQTEVRHCGRGAWCHLLSVERRSTKLCKIRVIF